MTAQEFLTRLDAVRETSDPKWRWQARCPAHADQNPSLSVGIGDDGWILLHCWAGCERETIVARLGLTVADLSTRPRPSRRIVLDDEGAGPSAPHHGGCTVELLAHHKGLPADFLRSLGLMDISLQGQPAVRIPFCDPDGTEQSVLHRISLAGELKFRWRTGCRQMLYGLPWLVDARVARYVVLVEGPSDGWTLRHQNIPVIGLPSAGRWDEDWVLYFDRIETIFAIIERDQGGEFVKTNLERSALRDRVRLVDLGVHKDVSALYLADRERFREHFQAALNEAVPLTQIADATAQAETEAAWRQCQALATAPAILDAFIADLRQHGITGEERFAKIVFLATVSRFQPRPVSLAAKGPSAAGKSIVLQKTLDFFPTRAYYTLTSMSERILAYSQEPIQHRMLVVYESQGLQGQWASYLMRSLLSEGKIRYETVMKTEAGLEPVLIEREGPTGLLTTTTKIFLHPENETRLLSVPVDDSPAQTRNVMRKVAEGGEQGVDFARWHALQTWLQGAEHRVIVPFAQRLAEIIPPVAVRLRRDFGTLLALIRAHATLHQAARARDSAGRILATLEDYAVVRDLVGAVMAEGMEASVSPTIRSTVEAVRGLKAEHPTQAVTVKQVANALGLDSPPALRRVRLAIERGYLKNEETRKGRPADLVLADPLPDDLALLPGADDPRLAECAGSDVPVAFPELPAPPPDGGGDGDGRAVGTGAGQTDGGDIPDDVLAWMFGDVTGTPEDTDAELPEPEWPPDGPGDDPSATEPDFPF